MMQDGYVPKNLLKIIDQVDITEDSCSHILKYAPLGTITHKQIKNFMAVMGQAHAEYVKARIANLGYKETDTLLQPYYNKAFEFIIKTIRVIINTNARTRRFRYDLLSDMYMHMAVYRDFQTKQRGLTKMVGNIFNATKKGLVIENLDKVDRVINNYLCFMLAGRVNNYYAKQHIYYNANINLDDYVTDTADQRYGIATAFNPFYKKEIIINRENIADSLLNLHETLTDIRIDRKLFKLIAHNYFKYLVIGNDRTVSTERFDVLYTLYKIREYIVENRIDIATISGNLTQDFPVIYPSFTKILADKLGVPYED